MSIYIWNLTNTTLDNKTNQVSDAYKDPATGNNKLSTITAANPTGYVPIDNNSSDPLIKKLSYAIQNDGKVTYLYEDGTGNKTQYNDIQQIANGGLQGYNANTTKLIKDSMQKNLVTSVVVYDLQNPTKKIDKNGSLQGSPIAQQAAQAAQTNQSGLSQQAQTALANSVNITNISIPSKNQARQFGTLRYPLDLAGTNQDRIRFSMYENLGSNIKTNVSQVFSANFQGQIIQRKNNTTSLGEVFLPIQPSITDRNSVEWSGGKLNALEAAAIGASYGGITSPDVANYASELLGNIKSQIKDIAKDKNHPLRQSLNLFLAQEAVGIQGVLSRASGAVVNPNLELLFNGPTLRPFNFTFKLSPRSSLEATSVRKIIRFFKEGMSVRTAASNVFLKSPHFFDIEYQDGSGGGEHKSLPRIKRCALIDCSVDYTPDGTYMTYNDSAKTLTSYQLSLSFSELDPIYDEDYKQVPEDEIGF